LSSVPLVSSINSIALLSWNSRLRDNNVPFQSPSSPLLVVLAVLLKLNGKYEVVLVLILRCMDVLVDRMVELMTKYSAEAIGPITGVDLLPGRVWS
jgi:hypothetical protein